MKTSSRLLVLGALIAVFTAVSFVVPVKAQSLLTDDQLGRIKANCVTIKNSLTQLQASDALLRVNRGQLYESLSSRLMNNFNARLSNNNYDNRGLTVVSSTYQAALQNFRTDYQTYERNLADLIKIDCTQKPAEFHLALEETRELRSELHGDVTRLHQLIDDYRLAVDDFVLNSERLRE
jgi:hypothetical protein